MERLTVKSLYLNQNYEVIDRNKDFYIYFEGIGKHILSIDSFDFSTLEQKSDFINFVKSSSNPKDFRIFKIKAVSGDFRYNLVLVSNSTLYEKEVREVKFIDIQQAIGFYRSFNIEKKLIQANLSITNEYMFVYYKMSNMFKLYQFFQNRTVVLYEQDLDSWSKLVVAEGLIPQDQNQKFLQLVELIRSCPDEFSYDLTCGLRGDIPSIEKLNFQGIRIEDEDSVYVTGRIMADAQTKEVQKSTTIVEELQIDSLTGVYNKKTITEFAERRFRAGQQEKCALVIVDIDHFKPVNDAYGHLMGDKVLEKTGKILLDTIGENGVVGRYGGDEFLLLVENMDNEQVLRGILRTIVVSIRNAFDESFDDIHVTASVGCAVFSENGTNYRELFKKADFCLYRAKDRGRDRYVFFRDDLHGELYKKAVETKNVGIKYDGREMKELKYMSYYMQMLNKAPFQAIKEVLLHMKDTYNLDSISIYYGEDMDRIYSVGDSLPAVKKADYVFSEPFKEALCGKNYIKIDHPGDIIPAVRKFNDFIVDKGVKSTIQCVIGSSDNIRGLVTFDHIKEPALWADYEFNCTLMFTAALTLLPESVKVDFALYSKLKNKESR